MKKTKKIDSKFIASATALIATAAMTTGLLVCSVSAESARKAESGLPALKSVTIMESRDDNAVKLGENTAAQKTRNARDGFPVGAYTDSTRRIFLRIVKLDFCKYSITITKHTGDNSATVYSISAVANGSKMDYSKGKKTDIVYGDTINDIVESTVVDCGHFGTFDVSDAGYTWTDSIEGTMDFVPWVGF